MQPSKKTAYDGMKTLYNFSRSAFNPFDEMSSEYLCFINNGKLIPLRTEVSKAMRKLGSNGQVLYETFVQEGLTTNTTPFTATIHKNNMFLVSKAWKTNDMKFNALTAKEDKKLIDILKCIARDRRQETLECLKI